MVFGYTSKMTEYIPAIIAVIAMCVGWAVHAVKISHGHGELKQRVKALEDNSHDFRDVRDSVIRMESEITSLKGLMSELRDGLVWMTKSAPMYGPPAPPSRRPTK